MSTFPEKEIEYSLGIEAPAFFAGGRNARSVTRDKEITWHSTHMQERAVPGSPALA
jgi:hypothetical protein